MILGGTLKLFKNKHMPALIISQAIIFTILHFRTGALPIFLLMTTGIFYGLLFIFFKRKLWPSTAAHLIYNYAIYWLSATGRI
jgi:membrane protease YdiL (CAAX protease family)